MKLTVLKLISVLVLIDGLILLGLAFNVAEVWQPVEQAWAWLTDVGTGFNWKFLILGGITTLLGFYGLIPQLRDRSAKTITYPGEHGEINIQVDKAEATLRKVVQGMPEVKSVKVRVLPAKDSNRAVIKADAVVINQEDVPARRTHEMITELIEETATDVLGLEIQYPIQLHITGTKVDPRAASEALHARVKQRAATSNAPWGAAGAAATAATASAVSTSPATMPEVPARSENEYATPEPVEAEEEEINPRLVEPLEVGMGPVAGEAVERHVDSAADEEDEVDGADLEQLPLPKEDAIEPIPEAEPENAVESVDVFSEDEEAEYTLPPLTEEEDGLPPPSDTPQTTSHPTGFDADEEDEPKKEQW